MIAVRIFYCMFLMMISVGLCAQNNKIKFHSVNTGGITTGEIGTYGLFQTVNGVGYKKWFAGIGAGYDAYYYKSIPLFADVRKYLDEGNRFLIYGEAGYNFPSKNLPKEGSIGYSSFHFSGGFYGDAGIGYKIKFVKHTSFLLSGGYSYKELHDKVGVLSCPFIGPCYENITRYNYSFGRLVLKAGIIL